MAARGGDVAGIGGIVAAQRPFAAVDDPLGRGDDPVERRAQRFVERGIEQCRRRRLDSVAVEPIDLDLIAGEAVARCGAGPIPSESTSVVAIARASVRAGR